MRMPRVFLKGLKDGKAVMELKDIKPSPMGNVPGSPENFKLNEFKPVSVFNTPVTRVTRARFPAIDVHAHAWDLHSDIDDWVKRMDAANIEKTIILSFETGEKFNAIYQQYAKYKNRFSIWCGFDYTGYDGKPDWTENAIRELRRCKSMGAEGVGELGDKGMGEYYSSPVPGIGMHIDDARMDPLLEECGRLKMPVSIHVADPIWMYLPMDVHNDGMMNAYNWRIELKTGMLNHGELLKTLEGALQKHRGTIFIACHFANCTHDLQIIGNMLDQYSNLYADISSRLKELATVPRYSRSFIEKYQTRLFFGSDVGYDPSRPMKYSTDIYEISFRLLETADEHIYQHNLFKYHWPLNGLELSDGVLKKLYNENARKILFSS
ncbi:MAG TPA: amidohydrolase family protein [Flavitalea sp.]|nr:amidohydrolase family protein [Flavitalea sp.]